MSWCILARQALLLKQAQNEFNKKFRGTDEFKTYLSEDKIGSFGKAAWRSWACLACRGLAKVL